MKNKLIKVYIVGGDTSYTRLFIDDIKLVSTIKEADLVLFTGGEDVHPSYYGEDVGKFTSTNYDRDRSENKAFREARLYNKLCLGICRGNQLLTVLSGGQLIQHVTNHAIAGTHKIHLMNEDVDIDITSTHHQMIWPFYLNKKDYDILAKSTRDLSTTYLNGDNKQKRLPSDFVECEIVYYKKTNCLCIQGHPEIMEKTSSAVKYVNVLIREYLENTIETVPEIENEIEVPNVDDGILRQAENNNVVRVNPIDWDAMRNQFADIDQLQIRPNQNRRARVNEALNDMDFLDVI